MPSPGPGHHTRAARSRRGRALRALACAAVLAGIVASTLPATGATSAIVVTADIPTATSLTDQCGTAASFTFGTVLPNTPGLTSTATPCRFTFTSSNGTAQLRVRQADQFGTAMGDDTLSMQQGQYEDRPHRAVSIEPGVPGTAWVVDGWGGSFRTTNSGGAWTQLTDPSTATGGASCNSVRVVTSTTAWVACDGGRVARTTNTGSSWSSVGTLGAGLTATAIGSASTTAAVVGLSNGTIQYTTNTGGTWTASTGIPGGVDYVTSVDMLDASNGYAVLNPSGYVVKTSNGGSSWTQLTPTGASHGCDTIDAVSTTVAWVGCDGGAIERTTNGTSMSLTSATTVPTSIRGIAATSATNVVAVGDYGETIRSTDGGSTWIDEGGTTLTDLKSAAISGTQVYAAGPGDIIVASGNSGDTWTIARSSASYNTLTDVDMATGLVAYAVGERGHARRTADGGVTWSTLTTGSTTHLRSVVSLSTTTAVAVGNGGLVLRTSNSGASFSTIASGTTDDLRAVAASDDGLTLIAAGANGTAIRSYDGGLTWTSARTSASGSELILDAQVLGNGTMLLSGSNKMIERSTDGGRTWTDLNVAPAAGWVRFAAITANSNGSTIYALSNQYNEAYRSTDSGATWTALPAIAVAGNRGTSIQLHGASVITGLQTGYLYGSGDGLASMEEQLQQWQHLYAYDSIDPTRGIAVGSGGLIGYTKPGVSVSDYGGGNTWGSASSTSMFGTCLQAIGGSAIADWTVDAANTSGKCESLDTDPWRAVTTASSVAAHTSSNGATGSVDLVWGFRPSISMPPAKYRAGVLVEVIGT